MLYFKIISFEENIDSHFHIYTKNNVAMEQALKDNFKLLAINTYSGGFERVFQDNRWLSKIKKSIA